MIIDVKIIDDATLKVTFENGDVCFVPRDPENYLFQQIAAEYDV